MHRQWVSAIILLALLLVPPSSAEILDLRAERLMADVAVVEADAPVLHVDRANGTRIGLVASEVHLTEYNDTRQVHTSVIQAHDKPQTTREQEHHDVEWSGAVEGTGYLFVTVPESEGRLEMTGHRVDVAPTAERTETARPAPSDREPEWGASVTDHLLLESSASSIVLSGNFTMRTWMTTLAGSTEDGFASLESGVMLWKQEPTGTVSTVSELYHVLAVSNGTLTIQAPAGAKVRTHLGETGILIPTGGSLRGASGQIGSSLVQGTVPLPDDRPLLLSPAEEGLRLRTPPEPESSLITNALPTPTTSIPLLALAAVATVALALFLRSRRPRTVQMLLDRMDRKQYRRVVRFAPDVMRRTQSEAVPVMKAVALMALGRPTEALRFLEDLPPELRPTDGMDPFLRAHALNESGRQDDARRLLQVALRQNPGLVTELSGLPRLRALLPDDAPPEAYT